MQIENMTYTLRRLGLIGVAGLGILAAFWAPTQVSNAAQAELTVLDGIFSEEQADRGLATYREKGCVACHGDTMGGTPLAPGLFGGRFVFNWGDKTVGEFFTWVRENMPPGGGVGLTDAQYLDIVTAVLRANSYPAGDAELDAADIDAIVIARP